MIFGACVAQRPSSFAKGNKKVMMAGGHHFASGFIVSVPPGHWQQNLPSALGRVIVLKVRSICKFTTGLRENGDPGF
jgi:hypothetical protein